MAWIAATASDYAEAVKQYNKDAQGVSDWERYFLQPTQQAFETAASQVQQQTQYDISGAYANYLKSQRNIAQQSQLGTGFKEQVSQQLRDQYSSAFEQAKTEEAQQLTELQSEYQDTLATNEEALLQQGERLAALEQAIYNYAGVDASKLGLSVEQGGLGYYTTDESGVTTLTDRGKAFFDEQLNTIGESGTSFSDWLYKTDSELYDFYTSNPDLAKQLIGGLEPGDVKFTEEEEWAIPASDAENSFKEKYPNYIDENKEFETNESKTNYYSSLEKVFDSANTIDFSKTLNENKNLIIPSNIDLSISKTKQSSGRGKSYKSTFVEVKIDSLTPEQKKLFEDYGITETKGSGFLGLNDSGYYKFGVVDRSDINVNYGYGAKSIYYEDFLDLLSKL